MDEKDLFNRDAMFWREVSFSLPDATAEVALIEPIMIAGEEVTTLVCKLFQFESHVAEYEIDNGGSFTKNEVKAWPYVLKADFDFYNDGANSEQERNAKLMSLPHSNLQSITLKDKKGKVILVKAKT